MSDTVSASVLDGLIHPQLASRILVANLLRDRLGDEFEFDPWASPKAREEAASGTRARIAAMFPRRVLRGFR
ncbi:MAG: hypothetical protein FJ386_04430 [Verrucomicrobia bacterium]|nr:hypothetical protein [Verrucomicrobiota bacterium]